MLPAPPVKAKSDAWDVRAVPDRQGPLDPDYIHPDPQVRDYIHLDPEALPDRALKAGLGAPNPYI